jgi:hypothetical protein
MILGLALRRLPCESVFGIGNSLGKLNAMGGVQAITRYEFVRGQCVPRTVLSTPERSTVALRAGFRNAQNLR